MAVSDNEVGKRLVATRLDYLAQHEPDRIWATIPVHPGDPLIGYRDISFKKFADAVDRAAWWLINNLSGPQGDFETITYNGPFDVQFPILAVAAVKCGKRFLLCSPWMTPEAQVHLLNVSKCTTYLHSPLFTTRVQSLLTAVPHVRSLEAPKLDDWLDDTESPAFPYEKTWNEAKDDPWVIFHTSGTTGLPKIIVYTNEMMTSFDQAKLMPDASDKNSMGASFVGQRYFAPIPPCHYTGMTAVLQWPIFLDDNVYVGGPSAGPITAQQAIDVINVGKVDGAIMAPSLIEDICRESNGLETLRRLGWISFAGAPLPRHVAMQLIEYTILMPGMGTTEQGTYWTSIAKTDSWECYKFKSANGIVMEPQGDDLYELTFHRKPELKLWQQVFKVFPDLDVYHTKDLWKRHASEPDGWCYVGRLDDVVVMHHGFKLNAIDLQYLIQEAPGVRAALVGGEKRLDPFLIIDLIEQKSMTDAEKRAKLDGIWPYIEQANARIIKQIQLVRDLIMFTEPSKPLPLTIKGTVVRARALELYADEIDRLYASHRARAAAESTVPSTEPAKDPGVTISQLTTNLNS